MSGKTSRHVEPDAASTAACQTRTDETSDAVIEEQEQTSCERNRQGLSHSRQNNDTSEKTCLIRRSTLYWWAGTCPVLFTPSHPIFCVVVETFTRGHGTSRFEGCRRRNEWIVPTRWCRTYRISQFGGVLSAGISLSPESFTLTDSKTRVFDAGSIVWTLAGGAWCADTGDPPTRAVN
ncbi:hypothetical protein BC629DRAFT_784342 [Irpex lacteus]|nr:hypothetical protein BC629DRAFT_784342 [Irpex lacteus]